MKSKISLFIAVFVALITLPACDDQSNQVQDSTVNEAYIGENLKTDILNELESRGEENVLYKVYGDEKNISICQTIQGFDLTSDEVVDLFEDNLETWDQSLSSIEEISIDIKKFCEDKGYSDTSVTVSFYSDNEPAEMYAIALDGSVLSDCVYGIHMPDGSTKKENDSYITKKEYDKIENGMSYSKVVEIIGSDGELIAESSVAGYTSKSYSWYGVDGISNANIIFQNGKVASKAQAGLD
ncbi:MAG: DUF3862 domain-containing protein [Prevotella sp.]